MSTTTRVRGHGAGPAAPQATASEAWAGAVPASAVLRSADEGAERSSGAHPRFARPAGGWAAAGSRSVGGRMARWESGGVLSRLAVVGAALVLSAFVVALAVGAGVIATAMLDLAAPS